jgi:hypothetical protein
MLLHKIFLGVGIHTEYAVLGNFRSREQLLSGKWDSISIHTPKGVRTVKKWRDEAQVRWREDRAIESSLAPSATYDFLIFMMNMNIHSE